MTETRIDDCLSNRDGLLFIEELASTELPEHLAPAETAEPREGRATVTPLVAKG